MFSLSIHDVVKTRFEHQEIEVYGRKVYTFALIITGENGRENTITLFSDKEESLHLIRK